MVGETAKLIGIVGDPNNRDTTSSNLEAKVLNSPASFVVQRRGGFVGQQDRWVGKKCTCDTHPLRLTSAEISGPPLQQVSTETNVFEDVPRPVLGDAWFSHTEVGEDIAIKHWRSLKHHSDLTPQGSRLPITKRAPIERDRARQRLVEPIQQTQQRRLS